MKKKSLSLFLAFCMMFSCLLSSCAREPASTTPPVTDSSGTQTTTVPTEPSSEPATEPSSEPVTEPSSEPATEPSTEPATEPSVEGVFSLNREDFSLFALGAWWDLYDGTVPVDQITFTSDDESVATFIDGRVTAVAPGTTNVHAAYNGETLSCIVRCSWEDRSTEPTTGSTEPTTGDTPPTTPSVSTDPRDPVLQPPAAFSGPSYFYSDAAFIGDSVSMMLRNRSSATGDLPGALFLVRGSYSVGHAVNGTMLLTYQGAEMSPEDALAASGVKKVFIMLGMNDLNIYGVDGTIQNWGTLISRIRDKCPNIQIYIQSMSPVWTGKESGRLNNSTIDYYNTLLQSFAASNGCYFINVAPYLKDSTNGLATSYCSDSFVHLTYAGADAWIKVLKNFAGY